MVDSVGYFNGLRFKAGVKEPTYYDLATSGGVEGGFKQTMGGVRTMDELLHEPEVKGRRDFDLAFNRPSTMMVLPAKAQSEAMIMGKAESDRNGGIRAPTGIMRNQQKGLAYNADKPIDLQNIMPISNNFNPDITNVMGNLI
jgi:hypothetical protein